MQHDLAFLPYIKLDERQRKQVVCKLSDFLHAQQYSLRILRDFLKFKLDTCQNFIKTDESVNLGDFKYTSSLRWVGSKSELLELLLCLYHSKKVSNVGDQLSFRRFHKICCQFFNFPFEEYGALQRKIYSRKKQSVVFLPKISNEFQIFCQNR